MNKNKSLRTGLIIFIALVFATAVLASCGDNGGGDSNTNINDAGDVGGAPDITSIYEKKESAYQKAFDKFNDIFAELG